MIYDIKNLSFGYTKNKLVLNKINLEINEGELITFLGKNGSGKTTLFSLLMGLNKNYSGSIKLNNEEIKNLKERKIASVCGYVPQSTYSDSGLTVFEYVLLGCAAKIKLFSHPSSKDEKATMKVLKLLKIDYLKDRIFSELSGGEKQQVTIARALVNNPKIIIFDEPTAHLDYANQIKVLKTIKELNKKGFTILLSTHDPNQALRLNKQIVIFNEKNQLEKGETKNLLTQKRLQKLYCKEIKILEIKNKNKICSYKI